MYLGDNLLAVLKALVSGQISINDSAPKFVYFDVLGLFAIWYRQDVGKIVNCLVVIATVIYLVSLKSQPQGAERFSVEIRICFVISALLSLAWQQYKLALQRLLSGLSAAAVGTLVYAKLIGLVDLTMFWYSRPILLLPTYLSVGLGSYIWAANKFPSRSVRYASIFHLPMLLTWNVLFSLIVWQQKSLVSPWAYQL